MPALRLVVIVGPTAVGKTATSIAVARMLDAEIVSADSRYLYIGMDIGTAKPSLAERGGVPHHLIDVTTPDRPWSLAQFQGAALEAITSIHARGRLALMVGGTGQYVRAIIEGWQVPPGQVGGPVRAQLEQSLAEEGLASLTTRLRQIDPDSAAQIDLRNPRRVIRALEVVLTTGQSFVAQRRRGQPPFAVTMFGLRLPRSELYARIDARINGMMSAGLLDEVRRLRALGYDWQLPAMSALGYRQLGEHLRGEVTLAEAVTRIRSATRRFVRRQANWFKPNDPAIHWIDAENDAATAIARANNG
jgi:tRNA dimethylallyltransferase